MKRSRKQVNSIINSLCALKTHNEHWKNEFIQLVGENSFTQLQAIYNEAIDRLTQEKKSIPMGYRYTGEFYIKKPYTMPIQYEKINGSAFMREDLVSWCIEEESRYKYSYFRAIYRDTKGQEGSEIKREEATPFYETMD